MHGYWGAGIEFSITAYSSAEAHLCRLTSSRRMKLAGITCKSVTHLSFTAWKAKPHLTVVKHDTISTRPADTACTLDSPASFLLARAKRKALATCVRCIMPHDANRYTPISSLAG